MTKTIKVYGASDDLVEVEDSEFGDAEYYITGDSSWTGVVETPSGGSSLVHVDYRNHGCWTVALGRYEEDYALPEITATTTVDDSLCRYSTVLVLEVPEGTTLKPYHTAENS